MRSSQCELTPVALEKTAAAAGNTYLTCPVFGRPDAAKAGTLIQIVSGKPEAKAVVRPLLEVASRAVIDVGDEVFKGEQCPRS